MLTAPSAPRYRDIGSDRRSARRPGIVMVRDRITTLYGSSFPKWNPEGLQALPPSAYYGKLTRPGAKDRYH
jgi:hypothetical protein